MKTPLSPAASPGLRALLHAPIPALAPSLALALALLPALAVGCSTPPKTTSAPLDMEAAEEIDVLNRLSEYLASAPREEPASLLNSIERLMISWQREQRQGRERPLEHLVNRKVIANFDTVVEAFQDGPYERTLVAAWALGFSRVPENPLGIESRHTEALEVLTPALQDAPVDVLNNVMLALWKLGAPETPLQALIDITVNHHVAEVRANAALALSSILTAETAPLARDAVLVALTDAEPKVRLHAASLAAMHPHRLTTDRILALLPDETSPLVRAGMAKALGASRDMKAAPFLIRMLGSPRGVERTWSHAALVSIYGIDRGVDAEAWKSLLQ